MLGGIEAWVRTLIWISFFIAVLELAVPSGSLRGYVRLSLGLLLVAAVLRPLLHLNLAPPPSLPLPAIRGAALAEGRAAYRRNEARSVAEYRVLVQERLVRLVRRSAGVQARVQVSQVGEPGRAGFGSVRSVRVWLAGTGGGEAGRVRGLIASYLDLPADRVTVSGG
ncbi:MAG: stage III sporulation protein AF [Thermaerobacter sp.]|nr:stage III sporulation protein AF [Thermaerobacter sp.]